MPLLMAEAAYEVNIKHKGWVVQTVMDNIVKSGKVSVWGLSSSLILMTSESLFL